MNDDGLVEAPKFTKTPEEIVAYWTPERMAAAKPVPMPKVVSKNEEETVGFDDSLVGLTLTEAREKTKEAGLTLRVVERDGKATIVTRDLRSNRINVAVQDDRVTEVRSRG